MASKIQTDIRKGMVPDESVFGLTLPGGGYPVVPIRGMEGVVLSMGALTQQVSDLTRELRISNNRQAQAYGVDPSALNVRDVLSDVLAESGIVTTGRQVSSGARDDLDPIHDGVPANPRKNLGQDPVVTQLERQQANFLRQRESIGYEMPEAYNVGSVRQQVGRFAQKQLMNRDPWGDQYSLDAGGRWHDPSGKFVSAQDSGVGDFMQRQTVMMAGRGAAQALAETGSFKEAGAAALGTSAGGMAVLKAAGIAGLAYQGIQKAGDFAEEQRAANAQWQSMMGGTNLGATQERWNQKMFGLSQFGVLDSDKAQELYQSVAATGLKGDARTNAQDFALGNYKQFGMDIKESMKIIDIAAKTGQESLIGVSAALERVTETAVEAGVNADKMRQAWVKTWEGLSGTVAGGTAATTATGFTDAFTEMGPEWQGATLNIGQQQEAQIATALGYRNINELQWAARQPGNEGIYLEGIQKMAQGRFLGQMSAGAQSTLKNQFGGRDISDMEKGDRELLASMFQGDPYVAKQMLAQMGMGDIDIALVPETVMAMAAGIWKPQDNAAEAAIELANKQPRMLGGLTEAEFAKERLNWSTGRGTKGMGNRAAFNNQGLNDELEGLRQQVDASATGGMFNFTDDAIRQNFMDDVVRTGRHGGFSEYIATDKSARTTAARVTIRDKDGKAKTVDLDTAMRHYREQLDDGTAIIAGEGDASGSTVGEAFKEMGTGTQNMTGTITIDLTPEFRRWLTATGKGDYFNGDPMPPDLRPGG